MRTHPTAIPRGLRRLGHALRTRALPARFTPRAQGRRPGNLQRPVLLRNLRHRHCLEIWLWHGAPRRGALISTPQGAIALTAASLGFSAQVGRISRPCRRHHRRRPEASGWAFLRIWNAKNDERQGTGVLCVKTGFTNPSRSMQPRCGTTRLHGCFRSQALRPRQRLITASTMTPPRCTRVGAFEPISTAHVEISGCGLSCRHRRGRVAATVWPKIEISVECRFCPWRTLLGDAA